MKWAVLVGFNYGTNGKTSGGGGAGGGSNGKFLKPLRGTIKDVADVYRLLTDHFAYAPRRVFVLVDDNADSAEAGAGPGLPASAAVVSPGATLEDVRAFVTAAMDTVTSESSGSFSAASSGRSGTSGTSLSVRASLGSSGNDDGHDGQDGQDGQDRVVIFFSGHGPRLPGARDFVPLPDAPPSGLCLCPGDGLAYQSNHLQADVIDRLSPDFEVTVIVDACFSGHNLPSLVFSYVVNQSPAGNQSASSSGTFERARSFETFETSGSSMTSTTSLASGTSVSSVFPEASYAETETTDETPPPPCFLARLWRAVCCRPCACSCACCRCCQNPTSLSSALVYPPSGGALSVKCVYIERLASLTSDNEETASEVLLASSQTRAVSLRTEPIIYYFGSSRSNEVSREIWATPPVSKQGLFTSRLVGALSDAADLEATTSLADIWISVKEKTRVKDQVPTLQSNVFFNASLRPFPL